MATWGDVQQNVFSFSGIHICLSDLMSCGAIFAFLQLDTRAVKTSTWPLKQSSSFPVNLPLSHSVGDATNDGGCLDDAAGAGFSGSVNSYFLFGHGS